MARNPYIPIAEAALGQVLKYEGSDYLPTPRALHRVMTGDVAFVTAMVRAFNTERGMDALRVQAVKMVLAEYGDAISLGRDAEHVAAHTPESKAREIAMHEQLRAQLDRKLSELRNEYAQMTLDDDLQRASGPTLAAS